jgi:septal ring factor EnvC (AmiA/AmiB activator)
MRCTQLPLGREHDICRDIERQACVFGYSNVMLEFYKEILEREIQRLRTHSERDLCQAKHDYDVVAADLARTTKALEDTKAELELTNTKLTKALEEAETWVKVVKAVVSTTDSDRHRFDAAEARVDAAEARADAAEARLNELQTSLARLCKGANEGYVNGSIVRDQWLAFCFYNFCFIVLIVV